MREIINSLDTFDHALGAVDTEQLDSNFHNFYEGIKLTHDMLCKSLLKFDVESIDPMSAV